MLDDLKIIHARDKSDALGVASKQWQQLNKDYELNLEADREIQNVVLAGMGGSALPGVFLNSWPGLSVPFEIARNYHLPKYVSPMTLVIISSYSGNTEETLSCLDEAQKAGAQIVVVTAGGKLHELAISKDLPLVEIPSGIQPRMSTFYFLTAFVKILEKTGLIAEGSLSDLRGASDWLGAQSVNWSADTPTSRNYAKQIAMELLGKSIVVYSGPLMQPAANKWKICFNENAKNIAWTNTLPEFNHNEFMGWSAQPIQKPYAVVELRSILEHKRIQKRFAVTERLLSGLRPSPIVIDAEGDTLIKQLLWTSMLGDFVSIYLAILNNVDPTPVDLVERFKKALDE